MNTESILYINGYFSIKSKHVCLDTSSLGNRVFAMDLSSSVIKRL